jgi:hypothetical protein
MIAPHHRLPGSVHGETLLDRTELPRILEAGHAVQSRRDTPALGCHPC